jgi:bifunctional DNA-binding transcriptional regulator/antitoxin component of YhaV-PrlF toxin-antitoxin module
MTSNYQKVLSGKKVSIPDSFSKKYRINKGDIVILEEDRGSLRIIPADVIKRRT